MQTLFSSHSTPLPPLPKPHPSRRPNLRTLTSRVVDLTRRKQLLQVFEEVEVARRRHGKLNVIVMNAVVEACVRCGDVDSAVRVFDEMAAPGGCGVDGVTYGTLLKGLGKARRIDEAFQILESIERKTAEGTPKLTSRLIYGLLNALLEAGDMRRANGLLARYRFVLRNEECSILLYNLLMKGYTNTDFPLGALAVRDEILRNGLKPDRLTYNTMIFACVKSGKIDAAFRLFTEMKEEAKKANQSNLSPDAVTYSTLLKGLRTTQDPYIVLQIIAEMKSFSGIYIDRVAYTAMVDTLLACGLVKGALSIFGEILKRSGDSNLRPKPHLYLSMMREFAVRGDISMVKKLQRHMWSDSVGVITSIAQKEADELLMEAAVNNGEVNLAKEILFGITRRRKWMSWNSRGGMVAVRLEAVSGFSSSLFSPYVLDEVSLDDPIENYMTRFKEVNPVQANTDLRNVVMRFYRDPVVPVIDDWGSCVGLVHREDCKELDAPLSSMMKGPPPCVTTSTSVGRVIELLLEKKYKMVVIVRFSHVYETSYSSSARPVGVFTYQQLFKLAIPFSSEPKSSTCNSSSRDRT